MVYGHLKNEINTVRKYLRGLKHDVYYMDQIDGGYSLKVEYLTTHVAALDTARKLRRRFPDKNVRVLAENENVRPGGYAVRIWVK
jgi:hypothetical protein